MRCVGGGRVPPPSPQPIMFGRTSEISGKAISSVMMMTSQPRNQATPLKIVSSGIVVADHGLDHVDVEPDRRGQQADLEIFHDDHPEPDEVEVQRLEHRQQDRQGDQQDAPAGRGTCRGSGRSIEAPMTSSRGSSAQSPIIRPSAEGHARQGQKLGVHHRAHARRTAARVGVDRLDQRRAKHRDAQPALDQRDDQRRGRRRPRRPRSGSPRRPSARR